MIIDTPAEVYDALIDRVVLMDDGTHKMRIVGVGGTNAIEDDIYLQLSSLTKVNKGTRRDSPVQYSGWFHAPHLKFA